MSSSPAMNKVFLTRKLSTAPQAVSPAMPESVPPFDPQRLIGELLSLGNERITRPVAETIGQEVQAELKRRSADRWTPEMISEIVRFKLEELGLIEIRRRRRSPVSRPPRGVLYTQDLEAPLPQDLSRPGCEEEWTQPLAEIPLRRPPTAGVPEKTVAKPLPPRASTPVSESLRRTLADLFPNLVPEARIAAWEEFLTRVAGEISQAETQFAGAIDPDLVAIEFFNLMANQEFLPHHALLLNAESRAAGGSFWTRIPLASDLRSQAEALALGQRIWESGGSALFELASEAGWDAERLEDFLAGVEKSLLQLPEASALPATVGIGLDPGAPGSAALADTVLSGQYYPNFTLHLRGDFAAAGPEAEAFRVFEKTWKKSEPSLALTDKGNGSRVPTDRAFRPGGGPALDPLEVCQLGSLNLSILASGREVDWVKLRRIIKSAVHLLDNWVEAGPYASEEIGRNTRANRKIGVGVMGFAELLVKLGIPYDSDDAVTLAEKLMRFVHQETLAASEALAEERGTFSNFPVSRFPHPHLRPRHASLTAVVPAPFLAAAAGVTPGLEPLAAVVEGGFEARRPLSLLKQLSLKHQLWNAELEQDIVQSGSVRASQTAPKPLRRLFGTRAEIGLDWEMKILAAAQRQCDGAVGCRLDLGEAADLSPWFALLETARELSLPLLALRRNPALEDHVAEEPPVAEEEILLGAASEPELELVPEASSEPAVEVAAVAELFEAAAEERPEVLPPPPVVPRPRADVLNATMRTIQTGCGPMTVTLARDSLGPYELQARLGKSGSCESAQAEAISRLTTLLLGVGVDTRLIHEQLEGIRCPKTATDAGDQVLSCGDAIAKVLSREMGFSQVLPDMESATSALPEENINDEEEITAIANLESLH